MANHFPLFPVPTDPIGPPVYVNYAQNAIVALVVAGLALAAMITIEYNIAITGRFLYWFIGLFTPKDDEQTKDEEEQAKAEEEAEAVRKEARETQTTPAAISTAQQPSPHHVKAKFVPTTTRSIQSNTPRQRIRMDEDLNTDEQHHHLDLPNKELTQKVLDQFYVIDAQATDITTASANADPNPHFLHLHIATYMEKPFSQDPFTHPWKCTYCNQETSFEAILSLGDQTALCATRQKIEGHHTEQLRHSRVRDTLSIEVMPLEIVKQRRKSFPKSRILASYHDLNSLLINPELEIDMDDDNRDSDNDVILIQDNGNSPREMARMVQVSKRYFDSIHPWSFYQDIPWVQRACKPTPIPSQVEELIEARDGTDADDDYLPVNWPSSGTGPRHKPSITVNFIPFVVFTTSF